MRNPWLNLPEHAPYVLEEDREAVAQFNRIAKPQARLHLELLPEPFLGDPLAPVVLLGLNPGFNEDDIQHHSDPRFVERSRANLEHGDNPFPFFLLDPSLNAPGHRWWADKLSSLVDEVGLDVVARRVSCVEFFPYHSRRFGLRVPDVPSQLYSFHLVREAIRRGAVIVIMRSERRWKRAVPELIDYERTYRLSNPRRVHVTPRNCPDGFGPILHTLRR